MTLYVSYRYLNCISLAFDRHSTMDFVLGGLKAAAATVGSAAGKATQRTKLNGELLLIEREMTARQQAFGVEVG